MINLDRFEQLLRIFFGTMLVDPARTARAWIGSVAHRSEPEAIIHVAHLLAGPHAAAEHVRGGIPPERETLRTIIRNVQDQTQAEGRWC